MTYNSQNILKFYQNEDYQYNLNTYIDNYQKLSDAIFECVNPKQIPENEYFITKDITLKKFTCNGDEYCWISPFECQHIFCRHHFSLNKCVDIKSYINFFNIKIKRSDYLYEKIRITYNFKDNWIAIVNQS